MATVSQGGRVHSLTSCPFILQSWSPLCTCKTVHPLHSPPNHAHTTATHPQATHNLAHYHLSTALLAHTSIHPAPVLLLTALTLTLLHKGPPEPLPAHPLTIDSHSISPSLFTSPTAYTTEEPRIQLTPLPHGLGTSLLTPFHCRLPTPLTVHCTARPYQYHSHTTCATHCLSVTRHTIPR